jgi:hypothetical protein
MWRKSVLETAIGVVDNRSHLKGLENASPKEVGLLVYELMLPYKGMSDVSAAVLLNSPK